MMKYRYLTLLLTIASYLVNAQIVINKYAAVLAFDPCHNTITVDATTGFGVGDTILLIQMKGATIDTTNTAAFGSVLSYNGAGNYELNTIESMTGNVITLHYKMARTYDIPDGKVQIVRVPYYQNYTINQSHTCQAWDGSKGGVFIINVANTLTMNDSIGVSTKGFWGSGLMNLTTGPCNETNYYYAEVTNKGAYKGEGITEVGIDKVCGKGPLGNGGGGGNAHNAGGAGGGNGGTGGGGGDQFPLCNPPSPGTEGIGGITLNYSNAANKIFMGGGGGGGHTNEQTDHPGGYGGGIVIIIANTLVGNSNTINSNGGSAYECGGPVPGCANDGVAGGGAGGTVLLKVNNYSGSLSINAKGGNGANAYIVPPNTALPYGPSGGGAGGVVWYSLPTAPGAVTPVLTGGVNGVCPQFGNTAVGATPGGTGQTLTGLVFNFPTDTFQVTFNFNVTETATVCNTLQFTNSSTGIPPIISWFWDFGNGTSSLQNPSHAFPTSGNYTVTLVATDSLGCTDTFLHPVNVISSMSYNILDSALGCTTVRLTANHLSGLSASQFTWLFGDASPAGTGTIVTHTYAQTGTYTVTLITSDNMGCTDTITQAVTVTSNMTYTINDTAVNCKTVTLSASHVSGDTATQFLWLFSDNSSATGNPVTHSFSQNGNYSVSLVLSNSLGCDDTMSYAFTLPFNTNYGIADSAIDCRTAKLTAYYISGDTTTIYTWLFPPDVATGNPVIHTFPTSGANTAALVLVNDAGCRDTMFYAFTINYQLYADFLYQPIIAERNTPTHFQNTSSPEAIKFYWDFGDSTSSTEENPVKQYNLSGNYTVCLTATDSLDCSATICKKLSADIVELIDIPDAFSPNGDGKNDVLMVRGYGIKTMNLGIYNRWGQKIFTSTDMKTGWDGTYKGVAQAAEVYGYVLDAVFESGKTFHKQGNVTILR